MICKTCGEDMTGDGFKSRIQCPNYQGEDCAPDSSPAHCFSVDREFFVELVETLNQWDEGEGLDAAFWHKLTRLTKEAKNYL